MSELSRISTVGVLTQIPCCPCTLLPLRKRLFCHHSALSLHPSR